MAKDTYYLTTGPHPRQKGKLIAVITLGHVQRGDDGCIVCDVQTVGNIKEARAWYDKMMQTKPWEAEWDKHHDSTN